jgi:hypothetical protein
VAGFDLTVYLVHTGITDPVVYDFEITSSLPEVAGEVRGPTRSR